MRPVLFFSLAAALAATTTATAQENNDDKFVVSGSIQSDVIIPQEDTEIGAKKYNEWALTNTYADIAARSNHLDAGLRFEFTKHPLPGYADTDSISRGVREYCPLRRASSSGASWLLKSCMVAD